jgi:hypothetical protein
LTSFCPPNNIEVRFIIADIIVGCIGKGSQDQTNGVCREIFQMPPDHVRDVQAKVGPVEGNNLPLLAIIEGDIETSRQGNEEFLKLVVGMAPAHFSSGNIIDPVRSLNGKRHRTARFYEGEVPPLIRDFWKLNDS